MKKTLFVAALAALALVSCNKKDADVNAPVMDDNAISFNAYSQVAVTRGTVTIVNDFSADGIGVFAFYQPAVNGAAQSFNTYKYATPDFMYNQQVKPTITSAAVNYTADEAKTYNAALPGAVSTSVVNPETNVNYTDSVAEAYNAALPGAVTTADIKTPAVYDEWSYSPVKYWPNNSFDQVSFFAYAPYKSSKQWEDMGIKTDVNGKKMVLNFPIYSEVSAQEDYLYANAVLNQGKQKVDANGNSYSTGTENVKFDFKHITAQVNLFAGVEQNTATQTPTKWDDENTTIEIKSIVFKGLSDGITYTYDLTTSPATVTPANSSSTQDLELTSANFVATAAKINNANYPVASFKQLNTTKDVLFLAPERLGDVVITYDVITTDGANNANSSTITNTITKSLSAITLEAGKSYKLDFLIGMNSVKIVASVIDWTTGVEEQIDVPANE